MKNFGKAQKGKIVGLLTSLYGISGAMFSAFYKQVFHQEVVPYFLFLAIVSGTVRYLSTILIIRYRLQEFCFWSKIHLTRKKLQL